MPFGSNDGFDHLRGQVLSNEALGPAACDSKVLRIAFTSGERQRRVVTRSRFRPTGKYPSWKMQRMLQWESLNELNAFRLLDCDPNVTTFAEQPCEISYLDESGRRQHYPDIYVVRNAELEFWEVKAESEVSQSEFSSRTNLLTQGLIAFGFTYRVVLDRELARQPRLGNARTLVRFGRSPLNQCEREYVRTVLESKRLLTWADACHGHLGTRGREILCRLVLEGVLSLDMDSPLCAASQFLRREA